MKLAAADSEDLEILSARLQDAAGRLSDFAWLPKQRRFACVLNRYRWEDNKSDKGSRVRAGLHFDGVLDVKSQNVKQGAPDAVVALLAIKFDSNGITEGSTEIDPGGVIELQLAGGGTIRLTVECISAELSDLTGPWAAIAKPLHEGDA
jgi:hypothetical protein